MQPILVIDDPQFYFNAPLLRVISRAEIDTIERNYLESTWWQDVFSLNTAVLLKLQ